MKVICANRNVIQVEKLLDVHDAAAGHLQNGKADHFVISGSEPLAFVVLQVCFFDFQVKLGFEGTKMGDLLINISVSVVALLFVGVAP